MDRYFILYLVLINLAGFEEMYRDKAKSVRKQWRTPEARFFVIAALLGAPGVLIGMHVFRHKTKHLKFTLGIPLILALQAAAAYLVFR